MRFDAVMVLALLLVAAYLLLPFRRKSPEGPVVCPKCGGTHARVYFEDYHLYDDRGRLAGWARQPRKMRALCWQCGYDGNATEFAASGVMVGVFKGRDWTSFRGSDYGTGEFVSPYRCPDCGSRAVRMSWKVWDDWARGQIYGWSHTLQSGDATNDGVTASCLACGKTGPSAEFTKDGLPANTEADERFHQCGDVPEHLIRKYFPEMAHETLERARVAA